MEIYRGENEISRFIEKVFQEHIKIMIKYFKKDYVMCKKKKKRHFKKVEACHICNTLYTKKYYEIFYYEIIVI